MHTRPKAASLALLAALAACTSGESTGSAIVERDSAGVAIVENDVARLRATCAVDTSPEVRIGTAEGGEEYELHRVFGATRLSDGRIALVNQGTQQVRFYDSGGRFLLAAGRAGEGPGEFNDAFYLWRLAGDTLWVGDYRPWEFEIFAPDGKWVRGVRPSPVYTNPPGTTILLADGRSVLAQRPAGFSRRSSEFAPESTVVLLHGRDGALLDTIGWYPDGRWGQVVPDQGSVWVYPLFESFARFAGAGSRLIIAHTSKSELSVYHVGDTIRLERVVRWNAGDRSIASADVAEERRKLAEPYSKMDPATRARLVEPLVSEQRPIASEFPAFAGLMTGRDGRIWVREYPRPRLTKPPRWLSFAADGRFACAASVPRVNQLLEFGADYLLAHDRDSLGVERVLLFAMSPPQ